jgi:hypothetical protein
MFSLKQFWVEREDRQEIGDRHDKLGGLPFVLRDSERI